MDAQERLTRSEALAPTTLGAMHVHRYELAADLCRGLRVADVGCGAGYGSEILARQSPFVLGIDLDEAVIKAADEEMGSRGRLEFEAADAGDFLRGRLRERFDAIVMLETLEHLTGIDDVLVSLRRHAEDGVRLVVSVPNSRMLDEDNPYHAFDFGYEEATAAFAGFPDCTLVYQFLAEGSVIRSGGEEETEGALRLREQGELEYAQQFIALVNFGDRLETSAVMYVQVDPLNQRYLIGLERANAELLRANAQLARNWLGTGDSAAAALVARVRRLEEELAGARRTPEDERMILRLHEEIAELNRSIAEMQATRAWRMASAYWTFKRRLRPGRRS